MTIQYEDLIGAPYKSHGRTKEEGFDCYGLAIEISKRLGKPLKDVFYEENVLQLADEYAPLLNLERTKEIECGTVLEMEYEGTLHIGICVNKKEFIHATRKGVRVNRIGALPILEKYKLI